MKKRHKEGDAPMQRLARELLGTPMRVLNLSGMLCTVSRLGYADEGLRLEFSIGSPHEFNAEVKLTRADTVWLRDALSEALVAPRNENLPEGQP